MFQSFLPLLDDGLPIEYPILLPLLKSVIPKYIGVEAVSACEKFLNIIPEIKITNTLITIEIFLII